MKKRSLTKYLFALPGFCFFAFAMLIPFMMGIHIAFTDWDGVASTYTFVGLANFAAIFRDTRMYAPFFNTLEFALLGTIIGNLIPLGLALLVNSPYRRMSSIARVIFFVPVCLSSVLTAFLWRFIYHEFFPKVFGCRNILGSTRWVILGIVLIGVWNTAGTNMLIYLSGLKNIPVELYEAAKMDGASPCQQFGRITLPLLMPSFSVCVTLTLTSWLKEFATTLSATGGGPGGASRTISIYVFDNLYKYYKAGYGQAISLLFALMLIVVGLLVSSFFRRREIEL
ncbi:MAG: sugar ABC transporter permease [Lachnospiraceae bacterium]|nr:sugar ABC transporter permease [Lachnospiraceae bacterium]